MARGPTTAHSSAERKADERQSKTRPELTGGNNERRMISLIGRLRGGTLRRRPKTSVKLLRHSRRLQEGPFHEKANLSSPDRRGGPRPGEGPGDRLELRATEVVPGGGWGVGKEGGGGHLRRGLRRGAPAAGEARNATAGAERRPFSACRREQCSDKVKSLSPRFHPHSRGAQRFRARCTLRSVQCRRCILKDGLVRDSQRAEPWAEGPFAVARTGRLALGRLSGKVVTPRTIILEKSVGCYRSRGARSLEIALRCGSFPQRLEHLTREP